MNVHAPPGDRRTLADRLFVALQYALPQHALSRLIYLFARVRFAPLRRAITRAFVRAYRPDMSDAVEPDPLKYGSFNAFFTRRLRAETRPLAADEHTIVSPVDGTVSQAGPLRADRLLQAKGIDYSLEALLAGRGDFAARFRDGWFATLYLAPYNYHRVHLPLAGTLVGAYYVPGRLFSVNRRTAAAVPNLFVRNERVVCLFRDRDTLPFAVILVGALNVGSISTVWHGEVTPRRLRRVTELPLPGSGSHPLDLPRGAEIGHFNMGSTVIVLLPEGRVRPAVGLVAGARVRVGEALGELARPRGAA